MYGNRQNSIHNKVKMHSKLNNWNTKLYSKSQRDFERCGNLRGWRWEWSDVCIYIHQINKQTVPGQYIWWYNKTSTKSKHVYMKRMNKLRSWEMCVRVCVCVCTKYIMYAIRMGVYGFSISKSVAVRKRTKDSIFHGRSFVIKTFLEYKISHSPFMWLNKFNLRISCVLKRGKRGGREIVTEFCTSIK